MKAPSWLRYAAIEFSHAFSFGRFASNRDITWMFAVLLLLISILAVTSAMYRGLVVNFAEFHSRVYRGCRHSGAGRL